MPEIKIMAGDRSIKLYCGKEEYEKTAAAAELLNTEISRVSTSSVSSTSDILAMAALKLADKVLEAADAIEKMHAESQVGYGTPEEAIKFSERVDTLREKTEFLTSQMVSLSQLSDAGPGRESGGKKTV